MYTSCFWGFLKLSWFLLWTIDFLWVVFGFCFKVLVFLMCSVIIASTCWFSSDYIELLNQICGFPQV